MKFYWKLLSHQICLGTKYFKLLCQGSFEEDYYALAYKSMSAFHWSRHFCHQVLLQKLLQLASLSDLFVILFC